MTDFSNTRAVKAVIKQRRCSQCMHYVLVGEPATVMVGSYSGEFHSAYAHPDCYSAYLEANSGGDYWDEWRRLFELDRDELDELEADYPDVVARVRGERLGADDGPTQDASKQKRSKKEGQQDEQTAED